MRFIILSGLLLFFTHTSFTQSLHRTRDFRTGDSVLYADKGLLVYQENKKGKLDDEKEHVGYWIDRRNDSTKFWLAWSSPMKRDLDIRKGDTLELVLRSGQVVNLQTYHHIDLLENLFSTVINAPYLLNKEKALLLQSDALAQLRIHHQQGVLVYPVHEKAQGTVQKAIALFEFR